MTPLTPDVIRDARAHLYRHGLRTDGGYGEPDGACCTVGHVAAVLNELDPDDACVLADQDLELALDDLFQQWNPSAGCLVTTWNDSLEPRLAVPAVSAFYGWLEQQAEAKGALT